MPQVGHQMRASRWGSKVGGRWWGGANAPGGWSAYRRPVRGWSHADLLEQRRASTSRLARYGLTQPPYGLQLGPLL